MCGYEIIHSKYGKTNCVIQLKFKLMKKRIDLLYKTKNDDKIILIGFSGEYEGWFSTNKQHVPLAARMEVFVENVYLELEEYKNWHLIY